MGKRMAKSPTQADVASIAGVSRTTVSLVLNDRQSTAIAITEETRKKVLEAAHLLGYEPNAMARSLRSGQSYTIGVLIPNLYNLHYLELLQGIEQELTDHGYHLILVVTNFDPERERGCFHALFQQRLDGLILMPTFWDKLPDEMSTLTERGDPVVFIPAEDTGIDWVAPDIGYGAEKMMDHLLACKHQRIGFLNGVVRPKLTRTRLETYRMKLEKKHLVVDPDLICDCGPTIEDGYQATQKLLRLPDPPTAIWAINDLLAVGVLRAIHEQNLSVPKDIAVAGFDDIALAAQLCPPLTTVRSPAKQMGKRAVEILLRRIQDPSCEPMKELFDTELIIRESTAATMI
jgi:LacI family transcriptional regulator